MSEGEADRFQEAPRYDFEGIDLDAYTVHSDVVKLVGDAARILELGPATGYMSRVFAERGATVVGIELDPAMAERAEEFCERVVVGDLDSLDLGPVLGDQRFDAIVAADVIEHLKDPLHALRRLRPFLAEDGCFVISVPNIAHGSVRLALLSGRFDYQARGLLDSTHLRFFTRKSFGRLLDEAELGLVDLHRHEVDFDVSEVNFDEAEVAVEIRKDLEAEPDARTYQFVAKATPMAGDGWREVRARLRERAELQVSVAELEKSISQLRPALDDARTELTLRHTAVEEWEERCAAESEVLRTEIQNLREERLRLQVRLDQILASPLLRLYAVLRRLPGLRWLQSRRRARFEAELARRAE